jgi:hypothetical protein
MRWHLAERHGYPHERLQSDLSRTNHTESKKDLIANSDPYSSLVIEMFPTLVQMSTHIPAKFFFTYVICGGFLDGAAGFVYSFMMSFHSFLVRAKVLSRDI